MPFGDGRLISEYLGRLFELLTRYLRGTDGQGSTWLIWGGLVVIGFILTSILFRTLILGDVAPLANRPLRRARTLTELRPVPEREVQPAAGRDPAAARRVGRLAGLRGPGRSLDGLLDGLHEAGLGEPRILRSGEGLKHLRIHGCGRTPADVAFVAGYVEGAFERLLGTRVVATAKPAPQGGACDVVVTYGKTAAAEGDAA